MGKSKDKQIGLMCDGAEDHADLAAAVGLAVEALANRGRLIVRSSEHSTDAICAAIRANGLFVVEDCRLETEDCPAPMAEVSARKVSPVNPGAPAGIGPGPSWRSGGKS